MSLRVFDGYDSTFAGFMAWHDERDARDLSKLFDTLMPQLPDRLEYFSKLLAELSLPTDLSYATVTEVRRRLAREVYLAYRGKNYPGELSPGWAGIAVDFGLFRGEVDRAHYPGMFWAFLRLPRAWMHRCMPVMYGVPGVHPAMYTSPVQRARDDLGSAATAPAPPADGDVLRHAGDAPRLVDELRKDFAERVEEATALGHMPLSSAEPTPPPPPQNDAWWTPASSKSSSLEQRYAKLQHEVLPGEITLCVFAAHDLAEAQRMYNGNEESDERNLRLASFLYAFEAKWPQLVGGEKVGGIYLEPPSRYRGGDWVAVTLTDAPRSVYEDFVVDAIAAGLIVAYETDTGLSDEGLPV